MALSWLSTPIHGMALSRLGIHVRAQGCGALVVFLLVLLLGPPEELLQYYRDSHWRRLVSSPTLSSWTLPMIPTAVVLFMVVLLIGFMVGSKRKLCRATTKEAAPKWSREDEVHNEDNEFTLDLVRLEADRS
jgi:hypothetical protein